MMDGTGKPRWSTGREDTRAIFRDGQCMGRMNETETAAVVVRVMNGDAARGETELHHRLNTLVAYWRRQNALEADFANELAEVMSGESEHPETWENRK